MELNLNLTEQLARGCLWVSRVALRWAGQVMGPGNGKDARNGNHGSQGQRERPPGRLRRRAGWRYQDKWTAILRVTRDGLDYGEAQCEFCGQVWEAAVPQGVVAGLECGRCGMFAGRFTCLRTAGAGEKLKN